ncbi:putative cellular morphogenesis protein (Bud22) [Cladophialophora carrionii]|uniref:Putative cellular morphogenesis protein (Bud22) n=1 Tax=Cladophialophora carrionii TaxID=86049 RepID=A0A1C1CCV6_9EURO|nr:putative cellular morphogenesis protein (Bud22) [Cladophialophora carrionii]
MLKRKREDSAGSLDSEDDNLKLKVSRLKAKTGQGVKALHNALKLARGFERQKLGRRQKTASDAPQTLLRLREEVIVLKQLQLEKTAKSRLFKNLFKTKRIREHPIFIKAYGLEPVSDNVKPGAEANVVGRLFNSNPVKQALPEIMKSIYAVLGIPQAVPPKPTGTEDTASKAARLKAEPKLDSDFDGFSGSDMEDHAELREKQDLASDASDEEVLGYAGGRLASLSEDSEEDSIAIPSLSPQRTGRQSHGGGRFAERENLSLSPTPSEVSEPGGARRPLAPHLRQKTSTTAFLPSLSMGGYYSGSDSEDDADQHRGPALPKPRKNRRGQRARQQIAELKYGEKAKHLGKQKAQDARSAGWDARRGAVGQHDSQKDRFRKRMAPQKRTEDRSAAGRDRTLSSDKKKSRDDQGPIHPSWEAAKRRKMQDQAQASFQGKKITFD